MDSLYVNVLCICILWGGGENLEQLFKELSIAAEDGKSFCKIMQHNQTNQINQNTKILANFHIANDNKFKQIENYMLNHYV